MRILLTLALALVLMGCDQAVDMEHQQQEAGQKSLLSNQPVPDLGGWSFERHIVIETYKARNRTISTYTYTFIEYTGQIIELCASIGYPIPYSTQLTNPLQYTGPNGAVVGNPEPNGLYSPSSAEATIVNCVNKDGTVTPTYFEQRIFALPYRIKADRSLDRIGDSSFSVSVTK